MTWYDNPEKKALVSASIEIQGATPEELLAILYHAPHDLYPSLKQIETITENTSTRTLFTLSTQIGPVLPRFAILHEQVIKKPCGTILFFCTSNLPQEVTLPSSLAMKIPRNAIKMECSLAGWVLVPNNNTSHVVTTCTYYSNMDMKGSIPLFAQKIILKQECAIVKRLKTMWLKSAKNQFKESLTERSW